jgi:hypothetical protein
MERSTTMKVIGSVGAMALLFGSYAFFKKTNKKYIIWVGLVNEIRNLVETKILNNSV